MSEVLSLPFLLLARQNILRKCACECVLSSKKDIEEERILISYNINNNLFLNNSSLFLKNTHAHTQNSDNELIESIILLKDSDRASATEHLCRLSARQLQDLLQLTCSDGLFYHVHPPLYDALQVPSSLTLQAVLMPTCNLQSTKTPHLFFPLLLEKERSWAQAPSRNGLACLIISNTNQDISFIECVYKLLDVLHLVMYIYECIVYYITKCNVGENMLGKDMLAVRILSTLAERGERPFNKQVFYTLMRREGYLDKRTYENYLQYLLANEYIQPYDPTQSDSLYRVNCRRLQNDF